MTVTFGADALVFTTQPADVTQGNVPDSIAVTEEDALGNVVDDNATVDFTVAACNGTIDVGDVQMVHGVATLNPSQRFYTAASALQISASIAGSNTNSAPFDVTANTDILFADGLEGCRL